MQYCKNCGKQLKDGARFCERCGQSVRQGRKSRRSKKQEQIEKLQRERLERKRRQEQRESIEKKRRERKREKRRKQSKILLAVAGVVAAVLIIAVISFIATMMSSSNEDWVTNGISADVTASALPTMQPSETEGPATPEPVSEKSNYTTYTLSNDMDIPYPKTFIDDAAEGNEELRIYDEKGDGIMSVTVEEYPGGTPSELMKKFANSEEGRETYSLAGSGWYGITIESDERVLHRKYLVDTENDLSVYYDFEYDADSEYADEYSKYIDYIDKSFSISK